ncbi:UNVERIFIED_CONTAM: hypothetical protein HDU68_011454 [Siphonaria sp. JEL0065]|nr:hypothetical protein HDU68_011454 [Siphonaria sp. JEL0065]
MRETLLFLAFGVLATMSSAIHSSCVTIQYPSTLAYGDYYPSTCSAYCNQTLIYISPLPVLPGTRFTAFACACGQQTVLTLETSDKCNSLCPAGSPAGEEFCGGLTDTLYWSSYYWDLTVTTEATETITTTSTAIGSGVGPPTNSKTPPSAPPPSPTTTSTTTTTTTTSSIIVPPPTSQVPSIITTTTTTTANIPDLTVTQQQTEGLATSRNFNTATATTTTTTGPSGRPPIATSTTDSDDTKNQPPGPNINSSLIAGLTVAAVVLAVGLFSLSRYRKRLSRSAEEMNSSPLHNRYMEDDGEDPLTAQFSLNVDEMEEEQEERRRQRRLGRNSPPPLNSLDSGSSGSSSFGVGYSPRGGNGTRATQDVFSAPSVTIVPQAAPETSARPSMSSARRSRENFLTRNSPPTVRTTPRSLGVGSQRQIGRGSK